VTYALGSAALVVTIEAGDRPDGSAVHAADQVILRPPFPDEVMAALTAKPDRLPIHGFVRVPEGCLPLGRLRVTMHRFSGAPGASQSRFEECHLLIGDQLPFSVLDRVRPVPTAQLPDLGWLDLLPGDPIRTLRQFVTGWFSDLPATISVAPAASAPAALAAFYEAAAGRCEPLGEFNRIFTPDLFESAGDGRVVFGAECQGVWNVLMDPAESDPAVIYDDLGDGPVVERERLAGFLVLFSLCDAAIGSPYGGFATVDRDAVRRLTAGLRPVPLQPLRWPADPTQLYAGPGLAVATAHTGPDVFEIYAGSRHRAALRPLREPGFAWEHFTG
jgi:hypothetical protein